MKFRQSNSLLTSRFRARWRRGTTLALSLLLGGGLCATQLQAVEHDFSMQGWATAGKGTTGGEGGKTVTVSTPEEFVTQIAKTEPLTIQIQGTIDLGRLSSSHPGYKSNGRYHVQSNKTLIGLGDDAHITRGDLRLHEKTNVIIRNIRFSKAPDTAVGISGGTTQVWIDHNDFTDAYDGLLDISTRADYITVSWNRFVNHNKVSLVGSSDGHTTDRGRLRVTYHHNWFFETTQRHPRVRYGRVHVFNNHFTGIDSYAIGVGVEANIVSESNFMEGVRRAWRHYDTSSQPGYLKDTGSIYQDLDYSLESTKTKGVDWSPSDFYRYTLNRAADVPELVMSGAGVGVIDEMDTSPAPGTPPSDGEEPGDPEPGDDQGEEEQDSGATISVTGITYSTWGGRDNDRHLQVGVRIADSKGGPVSGARVAYVLERNGSPYLDGDGVSDKDGNVTFSSTNAPSGTYTTRITGVEGGGYAWDGPSGDTGFTK